MSLLKVLLVCATLLVAALGKNNTPAPNPTRSSTSGTPGPSPTPLPPQPGPRTNYTYTYVNKSCIIMLNATMVITFTYKDSANKTHNTAEKVNDLAKVDNATSHCRDQDSAALILAWEGPTGGDWRFLSFNFTANGNKNWEFKNLTLTFNFSEEDFPHYPKDISTFANFSRAGFFDDVSSEVEYQRSYQCKANSSYQFEDFTNLELSVSISVKNFQVQAFEFKNNKTQFGNARVCIADGAPGSKIVPIAVGAALGVLVIAVIVAYVISKVVNRKKSSYEAL